MRLPVLDGLIADVAALWPSDSVPRRRIPCWRDMYRRNPGHSGFCRHWACRGMIQAEMRLGEGTGAVAALPLLDLPWRSIKSGHTFAQLGIEKPTPQ